ncbi:MAG TPA: PQQ-binding-like beta-propeller repeat protein [Bacteroidales bacterium]|nr:PQQ-binding-like beta-propeller repeat protein [Bacteroidales bacterium]
MRIVFILILTLFVFSFTNGQEYGWRGPGRSGIYLEKGLMKSWPSAGPRLLWETTGVGTGFSSAVVTDEAIYVTGRKGEKDVLTSFDQKGKKNWETVYGNAAGKVNFPETRCTPTIYQNKIFLVSGEGDMVCLGKDGKIIWTVNYFRKYNASQPLHGISESPLVVENKVIGTPGGNIAAMVAFNIDNGNVIWETPPLNEGTNYVNPLLIETGGRRIIITLTAQHLIAVNSSNGELLWKINTEELNEEQRERRSLINTPVYYDGFIFVANGYKQVAIKLKINPDGSDPKIVWKNTDFTPHVGGMVLLGNYIYGSTHDTNSKGKWICVDWSTGKTMWIADWHNKGAIISADMMLYIIEEKSGYVGLLKPDRTKFDLISSFQITKGEGPFWAHPTIDNGRLFLRHGDYLAVYSIKQNN